MSESETFKKDIRGNNFREALKIALSQAIELRIATWVVPVEQSNVHKHTPEEALPGHLMYTRINLVDGDIDNEIGSQFVGNGPYTELREFHLGQVDKGREIIQKNIEGIQKLFVVLIDNLNQLREEERKEENQLPTTTNAPLAEE